MSRHVAPVGIEPGADLISSRTLYHYAMRGSEAMQ